MKYSDIAKACVESGKTTGQYLRSCVRETVAKFDFTAEKPSANEIILLCPIKLYDRIIKIRTKADVLSAGALYRLGLYSKGTGEPELIAYLTDALTAGAITVAAKDIWTEEVVLGTGFNFETVCNVLAGQVAEGGAGKTRLDLLQESKYADDTEFFLGMSSTAAETGMTKLDVIIITADGVPSVQDGNKTILQRS